MKKTKLITLMLIVLTSNFFCQTSVTPTNQDSVYIIKEIDNMNEKTYYYTNMSFVCKNETGKIGFRVDCHINDKMIFRFLTVKMVNIGNCHENDEIIILLENGKKITKKSWKDFNCEGEAYFNLDKSDIELIKASPMSKIRLTNGRSYDSYTGDVKNEDKRYLIQLFYALDNKLYVDKK